MRSKAPRKSAKATALPTKRRAGSRAKARDPRASYERASYESVLPDALRTFFDDIASSRPIHVIQRVRYPDGRLRYTYSSKSMFEVLGDEAQSILSQDDVDHHWVHEDDRGRLVAAIHASAEQLTVLEAEVRIINKHGGITWLRSFARPRRFPDGTVVWDGIAIDVTEHHSAMEAIDKAVAQTRDRNDGYLHSLILASEGLLDRLRDIYNLIGESTAAEPVAHSQSPNRIAESLVDLHSLERSMRQLVAEARGKEGAGAREDSRGSALKALTARQREILRLVAQGHQNIAIAKQLGISEGTVKVHISALFKRLGVKNRVQASRLLKDFDI